MRHLRSWPNDSVFQRKSAASAPDYRRSDRRFDCDGNKRIGIYVMLAFLEMNGIRIRCTDDELVDIGLSVADGSMKYEDLLSWVYEHER